MYVHMYNHDDDNDSDSIGIVVHHAYNLHAPALASTVKVLDIHMIRACSVLCLLADRISILF